MNTPAALLRLETAEGVQFQIPLASPFIRGLAWAIDMLAVIALVGALQKVFAALSFINPDTMAGLSIVLYFVIQVFYGVLLEGLWKGRTIGKAVLGLQVIDAQGLPLKQSQIWIRNLLRFVDCAPICYLLGGTVALFSPHYQRIGDWAANTVVQRLLSRSTPDLPPIDSQRFNSFEKNPQAIASLRQDLHPEEIHLAVRALLRRDALESKARIKLFDAIAQDWCKRARIPVDDIEGISSENAIRNLLELLLKGKKL